MAEIQILDQKTIDKIAAGEVVERPASIVKELLENSIDAKSTAITVEIKDGGISFIRITDNGYGIDNKQIPLAFLRHSTSKIKSIEDLVTVSSLGFRGEALSSIAAVSQVELITKTPSSLTGIRYVIEGGEEKQTEEIGAPEGTTFIVRNLFYNTPVRRKFLKTAATEAGYVADVVEHMAMSHPEISIRFINNNQNKVHTSGNNKLKDIIYNIYGRDIASNLISVENANETAKITGYIGKPVISRGNRNFENYYINGRYIKSNIVSKAIEDAYKPYMMQHRYPFTALHIAIDQSLLDVNVHPAKMELRFRNPEEIYPVLYEILSDALKQRELIPQVVPGKSEQPKKEPIKKESVPEPFENKRKSLAGTEAKKVTEPSVNYIKEEPVKYMEVTDKKPEAPVQMELFDDRLLSKSARVKHRLIGQVFDTYWLIEYNNSLYIIDQHAAHEKVLYERTMKGLKDKIYTSQQINPPIILSLSIKEEEVLKKCIEYFNEIGYEIEYFGGREYAIRAVPDNMMSISKKELFIEMLDSLSGEVTKVQADIITERIASMSCKAAVKGNNRLSTEEADKLIEELLELDNPYNCPHGRPTIISMSKYEIEKKFKRIV
ncbi:MAG: DNA mismatch repair endonuclease MutL [Lachnospiraceae bacterium]|nr:DNA mismatch repair endonuclease MutL [Lachnospiraceae bacterium]